MFELTFKIKVKVKTFYYKVKCFILRKEFLICFYIDVGEWRSNYNYMYKYIDITVSYINICIQI
jgi:hypothetical protein